MKFKDLAGFDWNKANKQKNLVKHKVYYYYKECEEVFFNKPLIFFQDEKHSLKEKRYGVFGQTNNKRLLTIIFTIRNNKVRAISARDQNKKERKQYEQN
ncbi:hypothetical protein COW80_04870 [Candidatus Beckwithbacteria bacterium CG22_combo_CG10-13_8_21_14_all_01_47_9]|uniref:BrnT family toxin n=2 Tax=Candidatus Beckwithiibacteriota TaxID=1752726 RepID=A0A2H0DZK7_9BACT|nr:MAG: hypothetical protein COW80_04870 [Candidatus Beckwithbacteria bacterium CG22_combo_CG10-13_8_21_14_all_01_47_9]